MTEFWVEALHLRPSRRDPGDDFRVLRGELVNLSLQLAATPVTARDQMHLDLYVDDVEDMDTEVARLLDLGATWLREDRNPRDTYVVLADPEGNQFCVCTTEAGATGAEETSVDWLLEGTTDPVEVADRYDEWAASYDGDLVSWSYQAPAVVAEAVVTRHPDARSVLDVGCGTGLVGKALRARGCGARIVGLDISQASLRIAHQTDAYDALERVDLQQPLDVEDNGADVLVCVGVMTYLPDVEAVWREFARVVRPGGTVVVTQREDLWESRACQDVVDRLAADEVWTPLDVTGPAPYLPQASGGLAGLGCYYLLAHVR